MTLTPDSFLSFSPTSTVCAFLLGSPLVHHTNTQEDDGRDEDDVYWLSVEAEDNEDDEEEVRFEEEQ
ncbi:hypothetical protein NM688_g1407 [Phlebia brevispora]|uniref:Uncharacterized protein n=1 Tax=Phlebia brevispora TaxID=194682 RepID=A0ACC1TB88_9APHY|nr:hypothetical protein NM688_g1407 [Phlebia brevispora]